MNHDHVCASVQKNLDQRKMEEETATTGDKNDVFIAPWKHQWMV